MFAEGPPAKISWCTWFLWMAVQELRTCVEASYFANCQSTTKIGPLENFRLPSIQQTPYLRSKYAHLQVDWIWREVHVQKLNACTCTYVHAYRFAIALILREFLSLDIPTACTNYTGNSLGMTLPSTMPTSMKGWEGWCSMQKRERKIRRSLWQHTVAILRWVQMRSAMHVPVLYSTYREYTMCWMLLRLMVHWACHAVG